MKIVLITLPFIILFFSAKAQELINDNSFESDYNLNYLYEQNNLNYSTYWKSQGQFVSPHYLHSPDWIWYPHYIAADIGCPATFTAHTGEAYIRSTVGNFELFQQQLNLTHISTFQNILTMYVRTVDPTANSVCQPIDNSVDIGIYLAKSRIEFKSESSTSDRTDCTADYKEFKRGINNDIDDFSYALDMTQLSANNRWTPIEVTLPTDISQRNWLGILPGKENYYECTQDNDILYFDDISIVSAECYCPLEKWIENTDYFSNFLGGTFVQAQNKIISGYDVGALTTNGNVTIASGAGLTYRAGEQIQLESGFTAENGSLFVAEIGTCETRQGSITINALPTGFTYGPPDNDTWCFYVTNATEYVAHVIDRWNNVHDYNGLVSPNDWTCLNIDYDELCSVYDNDNTYIVYLSLYNCSSTLNVEVSVGIDCTNYSAKKENEVIAIDSNISIYPNPSADILNFNCLGYENEEYAVTISNIEGKIVVPQTEFYTRNFSLNISSLTDGVYYIDIKHDNLCTKKRFIKTSY